MESEKVKEIKKGLECCKDRLCEVCPRLKQEPNQEEDCRLALIGQSLILINELESENESCHEVLADLKTIIKQQNDRIAELEEYIKGNEQDAKAFVNGWHKNLKQELKLFAERLKGKFEHCVGDVYSADTIDERIDETLKEWLCDKYQ